MISQSIQHQNPMTAVVFAGPYAMRGTILSEKQAIFQVDDEWGLTPMQAVVFDYQLPGAKLTNWQVPWLLLNSRLIYGFGLA